MRQAIPFVAGLLIATQAVAETPVLTVYAPDYFASEWGPGPGIEQAFEAQCGCDLQYKTGELLPRLLLEGKNTEADIACLLYTSPSPRDGATSRMPSSA